MATTLICNALVVNEDVAQRRNVLLDGAYIADILAPDSLPDADRIVEASGMYLLPGVIDEHVHFREPGLTDKADIASESRAAAAGGVTSIFDMPNTRPTTTTLDAWRSKMERMRASCRVNYACFFGATNSNIEQILEVDRFHTPGIKLFMGASTGDMLVDSAEAIAQIFSRSPLPIVVHAEDQSVISRNTALLHSREGDDPPVALHSSVRSGEACVRAATLAVNLARRTGARLHVAHVSTAQEVSLLSRAGSNITGEVCLPHLLFTTDDYASLGARIKCNPSVKTASDRDALRRALSDDGPIRCVATDHAPHLIADKRGGCFRAASGMPMVQFSLPAMLTLSDEGVLPLTRIPRLMSHNPALLFGVVGRGFLRRGYKADLVLVQRHSHTITDDDVLSKCGWTPLCGAVLRWQVVATWVNGRCVYRRHQVDDTVRGEAITFSR